MSRRRLDRELVRRRLAADETEAAALVVSGRVTVAGAPADTAARLVDPGDAVVVAAEPDRYVGRGGHKLQAAFDGFGLDVAGRRALDAGASTGGFTDCLLQHGATEVVAVDVGHGQLHERLRRDPRVVVLDRTNVRALDVDDIGGPVDVVVADLSFISLSRVIGPLAALGRTGADFVFLVKPQFEATRAEVSRGRGVIEDPEVWRRTLDGAMDALIGHGACIMGVMVSPLRGADGNVEFLVTGHFGDASTDGGRPGSVDDAVDLDEVVRSVELR